MLMGINGAASVQAQMRASGPQVARSGSAQAARTAGADQPSHVSVPKDRSPAAADLWNRSATTVRHDLIDAVRSQISRGGYDTLDRLDAAADQLLASL
ncbi:MAG: hypothetical protein NTV94_07590 [Planctomycetota bacterium]|nr:hypothetical protein [Planctomycetota bacterium]